MTKIIQTDVLVVGGGATGAGVLRDLALRGIDCVLVEKEDLASGTTGRNHGLLHSGGRYAVKDTESATECIEENQILKKIAAHCIEDTGGLFVSLPGDDPQYFQNLIASCLQAGIPAEEIDPARALEIEPNVNPAITMALKVPDATVDPFRLAASNVLDASERGARVFTHTRVTELIVEGTRLAGVRCVDQLNGEELEIRTRCVVNASGVWGQGLLALAGIELPMFPSKGSMVIIDYRVNSVVINRARPPADGDIFVPGDTVSLIGTTSRKVPYEDIENLTVDDDEIEVLLADGEELLPNVSKTRVLRAYCGVRPLVAVGGADKGRDISRGIVCIDHNQRDGLDGLVTIAGGKLTTYRLMAQMAVDMVCEKLALEKRCITHLVPLPGSENIASVKKEAKRYDGVRTSVVGSTLYRHGQRVRQILASDPKSHGLICECEMVTEGEVEYAARNLHVRDLMDLRRRTRLGMGPCQGALCAYRAAGLHTQMDRADGQTSAKMLRELLQERFKGIKPVLWGDGLRETEFSHWIYRGLMGLSDGETLE